MPSIIVQNYEQLYETKDEINSITD